MKVNGFLALGIVLIMLGGLSSLAIMDPSPPEYITEDMIPQPGSEHIAVRLIRISCRDLDSGIIQVDCFIWSMSNPNLPMSFPLVYGGTTGNEFGLWEVWGANINLTIPDLYGFKFGIFNSYDLLTVTPEANFTILEATPDQPKGNLEVFGYYDGMLVQCEAWYTNSVESDHVTVGTNGYIWENLVIGTYLVHGIYNDIVVEKSALVEEDQTTIVQLNFGGSEPTPPSTPSYTPPSTGPSKQMDVTLIFMATGALAVIYGFVKQKKGKT